MAGASPNLCAPPGLGTIDHALHMNRKAQHLGPPYSHRRIFGKDPSMKIPGPDHPITITPTKGRVQVKFGGRVIADTTRAMTLQEANYPPVQYIPREDTQMASL